MSLCCLALEDQGTVIVERGIGTRAEALTEQNCMSRCNEGFRGLSKGNGFSSLYFLICNSLYNFFACFNGYISMNDLREH